MGSWIDIRVVARGDSKALQSFTSIALKRQPLCEYESSPGGTAGATAEPLGLLIEHSDSWHGEVAEVRFLFQTKTGVPMTEFTEMSQQFPALCLVLGYCDPNINQFGSYLIYQGRSVEFEMSPARTAFYVDREDFEGWEPMDEVVDYWNAATVAKLKMP